jgi:hypothetical protein
MSKSKSDTITLAGNPVHREAKAAAAIMPGNLLELTSAGLVQVGATANAIVRKAVALENEMLGKSIEDAYATNDIVRYGVFSTGQRVRLKVVAGGAAIVIGDKLSSGLAGGVQKGTTNVVAFALEAVDNSAGATQVFIDAEIA